ncbi:MAG: cobalamin biosynthesis protein [Actinoplanes sp.]
MERSGPLILGLGARSGIAVADLGAAVDAVLAEAGLSATDIAVLATVDRRAADPGVRRLALDRGWRLAGLPAERLARQAVPHPSPAVAAAVGTPSVAEAAALLVAGPGGALLVPKRVLEGVTLAIARA